MPRSKCKPAFTLIELLVVVAIIALLIAILLPSLARAREAAKRGACGSNLKTVSTACKTYAFDAEGFWPNVAHARPLPPDLDQAVQIAAKMLGEVER